MVGALGRQADFPELQMSSRQMAICLRTAALLPASAMLTSLRMVLYSPSQMLFYTVLESGNKGV